MKKWLATTVLLLLFGQLFSQTTDTAFNRRLDTYMNASRQLDMETVIELLHPKIFTLVPKEQMLKILQSTYEDEESKISFDTMYVSAISPEFRDDSTLYRKIDYGMIMRLQMKDTTEMEQEFVDLMVSMLETIGKVTYKAEEHTFIIDGKGLMFGIKDNDDTPWMFLGYEKGNTMLLDMLLNEKVRRHFGVDG